MYHVAVRNNETKEVRMYSHDDDWEEHSDYIWAEGNYSCDCNRAIFFAEVNNEDTEHAVDLPCGDEKYSCLYAQLEDGTKITLD